MRFAWTIAERMYTDVDGVTRPANLSKTAGQRSTESGYFAWSDKDG